MPFQYRPCQRMDALFLETECPIHAIHNIPGTYMQYTHTTCKYMQNTHTCMRVNACNIHAHTCYHSQPENSIIPPTCKIYYCSLIVGTALVVGTCWWSWEHPRTGVRPTRHILISIPQHKARQRISLALHYYSDTMAEGSIHSIKNTRYTEYYSKTNKKKTYVRECRKSTAYSHRGSNPGPRLYQSRALPTELWELLRSSSYCLYINAYIFRGPSTRYLKMALRCLHCLLLYNLPRHGGSTISAA